jgi:hypothetical protein
MPTLHADTSSQHPHSARVTQRIATARRALQRLCRADSAKHETGTREEWLAVRLELLQAEKETARTRHVTGELRNGLMGSCPRVARRRQEGPPGVARCTQRRAPLCRLCPSAGCMKSSVRMLRISMAETARFPEGRLEDNPHARSAQ